MHANLLSLQTVSPINRSPHRAKETLTVATTTDARDREDGEIQSIPAANQIDDQTDRGDGCSAQQGINRQAVHPPSTLALVHTATPIQYLSTGIAIADDLLKQVNLLIRSLNRHPSSALLVSKVPIAPGMSEQWIREIMDFGSNLRVYDSTTDIEDSLVLRALQLIADRITAIQTATHTYARVAAQPANSRRSGVTQANRVDMEGTADSSLIHESRTNTV